MSPRISLLKMQQWLVETTMFFSLLSKKLLPRYGAQS